MGVIQIFINKNGKYLGASSSSYVWDDPDNPKQLSIYVQLPVFVLSGVAEVVGNIATLELAYVGSPPSMKSLVMAFGLMTSCGGAIIGFIVNPFYTPSNSIYFQFVTGAVVVLFGPVIWFGFRNMKTGRDLMPELFEENLKNVIRTGSLGTSMTEAFGSGSGAAMFEMGSKHAMDAVTSNKAANPA